MRIVWLGTWPITVRSVGDHAQNVGIQQWFRDKFPNCNIIRIDRLLTIEHLLEIQKRVLPEDLIFLHSGGDWGSIYYHDPWLRFRRQIVKTFPKNMIVQLPVTVCYDYFHNPNTHERRVDTALQILEEDQQFYSDAENFLLCARDRVSFEFATENFKCKSLLVPDFVFYSHPPFKKVEQRRGFLLVIRRDFEAAISHEERRRLFMAFEDCNCIRNVAAMDFLSGTRKQIIGNYLSLYAEYRAVVTDRLHGMIFSSVTETPCVVLPTGIPHKILGAIEFARSPVAAVDSVDSVKEVLDNIVGLPCTPDVTGRYFEELYKRVAE